MRYPLLLLSLITSTAWAQEPDADGFIPLWNGKDLSGWVLVNTPADTWTVKDGMLICTGRPTGEIRTDRMYQNFVLEVEWRHMVPGGNAGIFVWADDMTSRGVPFHRSVEVQVLENAYGQSPHHTTHGDIFPIHGATMTPLNGRGGSRAFPTEERSLPSPQWNHYRIECRDGTISLAVNGKVVTQGKDANPRKGYICIESEGGVVHYRNLKIRPLPDTEISSELTAVSDRGYTSLYSGLDLRGLSTDAASMTHWHANDWVLNFDGRTSSGAGTLTAETHATQANYIFDMKPQKGLKSLSIATAGGPPLVVSADDAKTQELLSAGDWIRFELNRNENDLILKANGQTIATSPDQKSDELALSITVTGPAQFANLYARTRD